MEMNVFAVFPDCLIDFQNGSDLAAALDDLFQNIVDRVTGTRFPRRTPYNPSGVVSIEYEVRKTQLAGPLINRVALKNAHGLRQTRIKISWLHAIIYDGDITRFCVFLEKLAGLLYCPGIFAP